MPCLWSSFAQTPAARFEYAVVPDEYGRAVAAVCKGLQAEKRRVMAKLIEFYVPSIFRKPLKWSWQRQRGKVIEFCTQTRKSG